MKVRINVSIEPQLLDKIIKNVTGKSRAAKIRSCIQLGYQLAAEDKATPPPYPSTPIKRR